MRVARRRGCACDRRLRLATNRRVNRAARAALVTVAFFVVLEAGARLVPARWTRAQEAANTPMVPDPARIFRLPPGTVYLTEVPAVIDDDGLRVSAAEGPAKAPLILTIGDSSVFGHGVADGATLHDQLQARLARAGIPTRVRCGGSPGYSTVQSLALLDEVGWDAEPALLVVASMWSDSRLDRYRDTDLVGRGSILDRSSLFTLIRWGVRTAAGQPTTQKVAWPTPSDAGIRRVPLATYRDNLDAIFTEARDHTAGVVVLGLPHAAWVSEGTTTTGAAAPYLAVLRSVAEARGVPYVDGTDTFVQRGGTLFRDQLHPNAEGHALLAQALTDTLVDARWPENALLPAWGATTDPLPADSYEGTTAAPADSVRRAMTPGFMEPEGKRGLLAPPPSAGTKGRPAR